MLVNSENLKGSDSFFLTKPWNRDEIVRLPARTLAYIGDSVYELGMRLHHVRNGMDDAGRLHDSLVRKVSSPAQAMVFNAIFPKMSDSEQELVKGWRNAKTPTRHGSGSRGEYAKATALEAWVAYLFLTDQKDRLLELFNDIHHIVEKG